MTAAFEKFMRQYKMTGSEKADGYSKDAFVGLEEHEKVEVFKLLQTELPFSVKWMFLLAPEKSIPVVQASEVELRGKAFAPVYLLQEKLLEFTGDVQYQNRIMEDYWHYDEGMRPRVIDALARTPPKKSVTDFYKQIILVEANSSAIARAAGALLEVMKVSRTTDSQKAAYDRFLSVLRGEDTEAKLTILKELMSFESAQPFAD